MLSKAVILSLALAVCGFPQPEAVADKQSVSFSPSRPNLKRANGEVDGDAFLTSLNDALRKYRHPELDLVSQNPGGFSLAGLAQGAENLVSRATGTEPLTDQIEQGYDLLYYGAFDVGGQTFTADFDTGSADLFVPGPRCGAAQGCVRGTQYDQGGQDQHRTTSVTYGSGTITGEDFLDTVTVAGLTATRTNVISLTSAQGFNTSQSNSLMGMGFSTIAESGQPTFFENLMTQRRVTAPEFSFYLGRGSSNTASQSELFLGGRNTAKFTGAVTRVPVTRRGYWQVAIDGASSRTAASGARRPVAGTAGQAAIDTGTTIVLAPTVAATAILASIGGIPVPLVSGSATTTIYAYPCNFRGSIALRFAGREFEINNRDLSLGQITPGFAAALGNNALTALLDNATGGGLCAAAIAGADLVPGEELYVVGDTFLKNWYSIYNYNNNNGQPSVSFAAARGNNP